MATQLVAHLMLLDVGLTNSLVRFLAGQRALCDTKKASSYLVTAFYTLLSISFLLLLMSPFLSSGFLYSMQLTSDNAPGAEGLIMLTIAYAAISLPLRVGHGLHASVHRFDIIQLFDCVGIIIRVALIVMLFNWWQPKLIHLGMIVFGSTMLSAVLTFVNGLKLNPLLSLRLKGITRSALGDLSSMGVAALIVTISSVLLMQSSPMITGYSLGPASVILIAFPLMVYSALTPFLATFPILISPVAAGMSAKGEGEKLLPMFIMTVRYQASAALLLFIGIMIFGHPLIVLWLSGPKLSPAELNAISTGVVILFAGYAFSSVAQIGRSIMSSVGQHWPVAIFEFITALSGLLMGYLLSKFYMLDVQGMIVGVSLALLIRGFLCYPLLLSRYFKVPPFSLLIKSQALPFIIAGVTLSMGKGIEYIFNIACLAENIKGLIFIWVLPLLCWFALTWYLIIPKEHQRLLRDYFLK